MKKIKRDLRTKSNSSKKMLRRGSRLSMIPNRSSRKILKRREWRVSSSKPRLVSFRAMWIRESRL